MTEKTKEELEKAKLLLEIQQIEEKWWKKPAYAAAFIPAIIALFTIGQMLWTNHFKNERTLLRIETIELKTQRDVVIAQKKNLDAATKEMEKQKKQTEKELNQARENLRSERALIKKTLEDERIKNERELTFLQKQHQEKISKLKISQFKSMIQVEDFNPQHPSSDLLITRLQQDEDESLVNLIIEQTNLTDDPTLKANLLYILYKGTGYAKWREAITDLSLENPSSYSATFWEVLGMGQWEASKQEVWEILVDIMNEHSLSADAVNSLFLDQLNHLSGKGHAADCFKEKNKYFDTIRHARQNALDSTTAPDIRFGLWALENLDPEAFLTILAMVMADPDINLEDRNAAMYEFHSMNGDDIPGKKHLESLVTTLEYPTKEDGDWHGWLERNQRLVEFWIEDKDLKAAKQIFQKTMAQRYKELASLSESVNKIYRSLQSGGKKLIKRHTLTEFVRLYDNIDKGLNEGKALSLKMESFYQDNGYKGQIKDVLFPLKGVVLGQTTVEELSRLGTRSNNINDSTGEPYKTYTIMGTKFWFHEKACAEHIYLTETEKIPTRWRLAGFDWEKSFNDWQALFKSLGWVTKIIEGPHNVPEGENGSFRAELEAEGNNLILNLEYDYGKGTLTSSLDTLYSINVWVK